MPEEPPKITTKSGDYSVKGRDKASLIRLISQTVIKLDSARKSIQMYPEGHEAIQKSMEEVSSLLSKLFNLMPVLPLTVEKDSLLFENETLDTQQTGVREFLSVLKLYDIIFIQFKKELPQKELLQFLTLFPGKKDSSGRRGEAVKNSLSREFSHITVRFVDYSGLGLAIEEEISGPVEHSDSFRSGATTGPTLAPSRPSSTASGPFRYGAETGPTTPIQNIEKAPVYRIEGDDGSEKIPIYSPDKENKQNVYASAEDYEKSFGSFFNKRESGRGGGQTGRSQGVPEGEIASVTDYENLLKSYLNTLGEMGAASPETPDGSDPDISERVQTYEKRLESYLTHPKKSTGEPLTPREHTKIIQTFLKQLNPTLRKQFESFDFGKLLQEDTARSFDTLLDSDNVQTTFDALKQANEEDREISPTLISLVKKMFSSLGEKHSMQKKAETAETEKLQNHIEQLFERETYEKFVIDAYEKRLKQLTDSSSDMFFKNHSFSLEASLKTLDDAPITRQITHAMTSLIDEEKTPEIYKDYLNCLLIISADLFKYNEFEWLKTLYSLFKQHGDSHPDPKIRVTAQKGSAHFLTQSCISRILETMKNEQKETADQAKDFFMLLGGETVPALMALFFNSTNPVEQAHLTRKLEVFRKETISNLHQVLSSQDVFLSEHLITLMIQFKDETIAPFFQPLRVHEDPEIQKKALNVLLEYGDPDAINQVRDRILSKETSVCLSAIEQAGQFRVKALVPDLVRELTRHFLFMSDMDKKEAIVRALGAIGDPSALPVFEEIAGRSFSLRSRHLNNLKCIIFQSLERFPTHELSGLITMGKRLKDQRIQAAIETLSVNEKSSNEIEDTQH